jgi:carbonic anhydrase/acetyltransferase-like protein (isoleucine patch superfamily)
MLLCHQNKRPTVHDSAYLAPTAVLCGDVTIGPETCVAFGAVIVAEGAPVVIDRQTIIRENAVVRATAGHAVRIGSYVLVGPHAALMGCTVADEAFLATGVTIFHGATIGRGAEVRVNGVVHVKTVLPPGAVVPIGWVAVGNPARILPPNAHDEIWAVQKPLNFPLMVYGVDREPEGTVNMQEITRRLAEGLRRHREDRMAGQ